MALFVIVARGRRADEARPIIAISDEGLIEKLLEAVQHLTSDVEDEFDSRAWRSLLKDDEPGEHDV